MQDLIKRRKSRLCFSKNYIKFNSNKKFFHNMEKEMNVLMFIGENTFKTVWMKVCQGSK